MIKKLSILCIYECSFKIQNNHFKPHSDACHKVQFQKNLMNRFRQKFISVDFWPENDLFTLFWAKQDIYPKMGPATF